MLSDASFPAIHPKSYLVYYMEKTYFITETNEQSMIS